MVQRPGESSHKMLPPPEHPFWLRPDAPAAAYALVEPLRLEIETLQGAVEVASEQAAEALASAQRATAEAHARRAQVAWAGGRVAQLENALKEAGAPVPPPVKPPPPPPEAAKAQQKTQAGAPATAPDNERTRVAHLEKELAKAKQEVQDVARQRDVAQRALEAQNALASGAGRRATRGDADEPADPARQEAAQGELVKALNAERQRAQRAEELAKQLTEMLKRLEEASRSSAAATAASTAASGAAAPPAAEAAVLRRDLAAAKARCGDLEAEVQSLRQQQGMGSRSGQGPVSMPPPSAPLPLNSKGLGGGKSLVPPGVMSPAEVTALRDRAEHAEADAAALKEQLGAATRRAQVLQDALAQAPARPGPGPGAVPPDELQRLQSRCRALQARADESAARIAELESLLSRPDSRVSNFSASFGGTMSAAPSPVPSPGSTPSFASSARGGSEVPTPLTMSPPGSPRSGSTM